MFSNICVVRIVEGAQNDTFAPPPGETSRGGANECVVLPLPLIAAPSAVHPVII